MSHDNLGYTGSTATIVDIKKPVNGTNEKKIGNGFHVVELQDKGKPNTNAKELELEYDPYSHRQVQHPTTFWETLLHFLKGSLGTGILAMPLAFHHAGWLVGVFGTIIIGLLSTYCIRSLIVVEYELCKRRRVPSLTYPLTMQYALEEGPKCLRPLARVSPHICNAFLMTYQLGTCCVYTVFIAENLRDGLNDNGYFDLSVTQYQFIILLPLILINWVRNLKLLAPLSTIANAITLVTFSIIAYYIFNHDLTLWDKPMMGEVKDFPLFLGTVLFALEAIGVIMPLENEMKKPKKFIRPVGVLNIGMLSNVLLYVGMGFFGYLRYGKNAKPSITLNLQDDHKGDMLARSVQVLLAVAIYISHSLQCYVAIDLSWNEYIQPKLEYLSTKKQIFYEYVTRTSIVVLTFILAVLVPELDLFISLFGALCLASLGISFPALMQICVFWNIKTTRGRVFLVMKNTAVFCFGILGLIVGTYTSLEKIIANFGAAKP